MAKAIARGDKRGILRAIEIWEALGIKKWNFGAMPFDEEELSINTWDGCTKKSYKEKKANYNRLNNLVIKMITNLNNGTPLVMRVRKNKVSKICKSTKPDGRSGVGRRINIAVGCMSSAQNINTKLTLGIDVYEKVMTGTLDKLQIAGHSSDEATEMMVQAINARKKIEYALGKSAKQIRKELCNDLLKELDNKPALIENDKRVEAAMGEDSNTDRRKKK